MQKFKLGYDCIVVACEDGKEVAAIVGKVVKVNVENLDEPTYDVAVVYADAEKKSKDKVQKGESQGVTTVLHGLYAAGAPIEPKGKQMFIRTLGEHWDVEEVREIEAAQRKALGESNAEQVAQLQGQIDDLTDKQSDPK